MAAFLYLKLTDKLACQASPAVYGVLRPEDLVAASDVRAVEDQESLSFKFTRLDAAGTVRPITAQLRAGRVIAVVMDDGSFDEWRVGQVTMGRGEKGLVSVVCVPLWLDLVERADTTAGKGWVSALSAGIRGFDYAITQQTPTAILTSYVIANLPSWITLGTVDPTYTIPSLSVSRLTPGALALAVRDALRSVDVACELRLRRNGTTDYKLDLVTQIGASGATPVFHPSTSLLALQQRADATLQATRVLVKGSTAPDTLPGVLGRARWRVSAVAGTVLTLADRNGGSSPIAFDSQFVGNYLLRVKTGATFPITASSGSAGSVTCSGGVSTIAVDEDVEFRLTEPSTNTRTTTTRYAVSAVPDGTHITCAAANPITVDGQYTDWYARVWSLSSGGSIIITTRISTSVASTDVLTVASSAGVTTSHFVEFIQLDGAGEIPAFIDHPTYAAADPTGYGIKAMELSKPQIGVTQLVKNGWMRAWASSGSPPDGYTTNGTGTFSRNASSSFTRYGGFSWAFTGALSSNSGIYPPPVYLTSDSGFCSVRVLIYYTAFNTQAAAKVEIAPATPAGAPSVGAIPASGVATYSLTVGATDYVATPVALVGTGAWVELKIENIPITPSLFPYGMSITVLPGFGGVQSGYVDAIECYPFAACPNDIFEFGDAMGLHQAGNNQLRLAASPPLFYTFTIRDLERAFPTEYARLAVTLGANARAADVEYGIDTTVRVLRIDRDLLKPSETTLTLANRPTLLTAQQSAVTAATRSVIAAVIDGQSASAASGASFATVSAAATLPSSAELAVASTTAFAITLGLNSSISYKPTSGSTPITTVTSGTPPSRFIPRDRPSF